MIEGLPARPRLPVSLTTSIVAAYSLLNQNLCLRYHYLHDALSSCSALACSRVPVVKMIFVHCHSNAEVLDAYSRARAALIDVPGVRVEIYQKRMKANAAPTVVPGKFFRPRG